MFNLHGKTAFITGGATGVGLAIAHAFGREGMNLMIADSAEPALQRAVEDLRAKKFDVQAVAVDVTSRDSLRAAALATIAAFSKVHVLCNGASMSSSGALLGQLPETDWDRMVGVNIYGVLNSAEVFVPLMESHGEGGHLVNVGSAASLIVRPGFEADCGTRFAVMAINEGWREQLALRNIGVSVVCPADVDVPAANGANAPEILGARVVEGIKNDEFYIMTHAGAFRETAEARFDHIRAAFRKSQSSPHLRDLPARALPAG